MSTALMFACSICARRPARRVWRSAAPMGAGLVCVEAIVSSVREVHSSAMAHGDNEDEASTLLGRARRYAGVTSGIAGVALRGAGRWLGGGDPFGEGNARDLAR